ncbi:MAG: DUF3833 family protein [Rhizobiaceae bacterium]
MPTSIRTIAIALSTLTATPAFAEDAMLKFFKGDSSATANFKAINGLKRDFTVTLDGKWNGKTLTLREDFVYSDGEKARKTWRFTKLSEGKYSGTREDVIGTTNVRVKGNLAKFTYLIDLDEGPGENIVRFYDTIKFSEDGKSALNTAIVTKYGFPVAKVRVDFVR